MHRPNETNPGDSQPGDSKPGNTKLDEPKPADAKACDAKKGDTRERLLSTAADLIWRSSYHATGVDRICESAGVKKGSFYHFFESKEELAIAAIDAATAEYRPRLDAIFSKARPPLERLREYARECVERQREKQRETGVVCGCPLLAIGSEVGTQQSPLRKKVEELLDWRLRNVEGAIRDAHACGAIVAPDPSRKARIVVDFIEGALTRARILNDLAPLAGLEDMVLEVLGASPAEAQKP